MGINTMVVMQRAGDTERIVTHSTQAGAGIWNNL